MLFFFRNKSNASSSNNTATRNRPVKSHRPVRKVYGPDRIGIVGFERRAFVIARPADPYAHWLQTRIKTLPQRLGSTTNLTAGIRQSVDLLKKTPEGALRRIWLLSDGAPNEETGGIASAVEAAKRARCNINCIGFGPGAYDEKLLRSISKSTHNGKFVAVNALRKLTDTLIAGAGNGHRNHRHRQEYTVITIDMSASMGSPMEGKTRIEVVREAVLRLLAYKQQNFD